MRRAAIASSRQAMAQEFTEADLSPTFRSNGTRDPAATAYQALAANGFADWRLQVDGLVAQPGAVLARGAARVADAARRSRGTIASRAGARSASGPARRLHECSTRVQPEPSARYVVFHCADPMEPSGTEPVLREHRHGRCLSPADDPRVRAERRGAADRQRRADPRCASSASSATRWRSTSCASSWSTALRASTAARAVIGKTAVTSGMPASRRGIQC